VTTLWLVASCLVPLGLALAARDQFTLSVLAFAATQALYVASWDLVGGASGQPTLGHALPMGVGAYFTTFVAGWNLAPLPIAVVGGALAGGLAGVLQGTLGARLSRLSLALVTLATAESAREILGMLIFMWPGGLVVGGNSGIPMRVYPADESSAARLAAAVLAVGVTGLLWVSRSSLGLAMRTARADDRLASASGIDVVRVRVLAFVIAGGVAGLAGGLAAGMVGRVSPAPVLVCRRKCRRAGHDCRAGGGRLHVGRRPPVARRPRNAPPHAGRPPADRRRVRPLRGSAPETDAPRANVVGRGRRPMTPSGATPPASGTGLLRVEGLVKRFEGTVALDGLTLQLAAGESLGISGSTGSGKSTLVNVIAGCVRPDRGCVWLGDREITRWSPHRVVRAGIARTFQRPRVGFHFTVEQNLQAATLHRRLGGARRRRVVNQILEIVDLAPLREREARTLSLGEIRRVELGRALATGGRVLLLDEPFASLSSEDGPEVLSVLRRLRREGETMLIVAHSAFLFRTLCDRVAVIEGGRIIRDA